MYGDQCGEFVCESYGLNGYKGVMFPRRGYTLLCTEDHRNEQEKTDNLCFQANILFNFRCPCSVSFVFAVLTYLTSPLY